MWWSGLCVAWVAFVELLNYLWYLFVNLTLIIVKPDALAINVVMAVHQHRLSYRVITHLLVLSILHFRNIRVELHELLPHLYHAVTSFIVAVVGAWVRVEAVQGLQSGRRTKFGIGGRGWLNREIGMDVLAEEVGFLEGGDCWGEIEFRDWRKQGNISQIAAWVLVSALLLYWFLFHLWI